MEYYSAIRQKILLFAATWTDFEGIMLSKVKSDKYCRVSHGI